MSVESGFVFQEGLVTVKGKDSQVLVDGAKGFGFLPYVVAAAGANQAAATEIPVNATVVIVNSVGSGEGVKLNDEAPVGTLLFIFNTDASETLEIYPETDGNINGASDNAPYTVPAASLSFLFRSAPLTWRIGETAAAAA